MNDEESRFLEGGCRVLVWIAEFWLAVTLAFAAAIAIPGLPAWILAAIGVGVMFTAGRIDGPVIEYAIRKMKERRSR